MSEKVRLGPSSPSTQIAKPATATQELDRPGLRNPQADFRVAAEALGRGIALGDPAEYIELTRDWSRETFRQWWPWLQSQEARMWQVRGHAWAPGGRMWQGAAGLRARLDADARARRMREKPVADYRRRETASHVFRLLKQRTPAPDLRVAVHRANVTRADPLPMQVVDQIIVWAAERANGSAHARG